MVKNLPSHVGHSGSIPGLGRSPEEGNGNPFLAWETQVFLPGKSMDREAWQATVHAVTGVGN